MLTEIEEMGDREFFFNGSLAHRFDSKNPDDLTNVAQGEYVPVLRYIKERHLIQHD